MSTTSLTAGEVMDRSAALMNDPAKTDYTYTAQLPYLNMAIDELAESLEESNSSPSNITSAVISLAVGEHMITYNEHLTLPHYPTTLVEIQSIGERDAGTENHFVPLGRRDFVTEFPVNPSLMFWAWEEQIIKFNPNGASVAKDIQLQYIREAVTQAVNELSVIGTINSRSYLAYKTAALCSQYIGENEGRAASLDVKAEAAMDRLTGINNKGRQQIMTRHRPFRAAYKARGGW